MTTETISPGRALKAAREAAGLSRRQLAASMDLSPSRLADIEADRKPHSMETLAAIAKAHRTIDRAAEALKPRRKPDNPRP